MTKEQIVYEESNIKMRLSETAAVKAAFDYLANIASAMSRAAMEVTSNQHNITCVDIEQKGNVVEITMRIER